MTLNLESLLHKLLFSSSVLLPALYSSKYSSLHSSHFFSSLHTEKIGGYYQVVVYKAQVHIVQVQCKCDKLLRYIAKFTCNALMLLSWFCFRHCSGKTQFQATSMTQARRSVRFERKPSQRYSRRPKFEKKESDMAATTSDLLPSTSEQRYSQLLISSSKLFLVLILLLLFSGDIH